MKRKVNDLVPFSKNPRKITDEAKERLKASLEKFNLAEIPVINFDNTLISGNQRCQVLQMIGRGDKFIDVRYPNRQLTEHEVKEYNLTANSHAGTWNMEILNLEFADFDLKDFNITLPDFEKEEKVQTSKNIPAARPVETEKRWFVYIDCVTEKEAQKMYTELSGRGFETKVVN